MRSATILLLSLLPLIQSFTAFLPAKLSNPSPSFSSSTLSAKLSISKYHGLGNDFILATGASSTPLTPAQSSKLCNRNFGIGADGVIFKLDGDSTGASTDGAPCDYKMIIHNADGTIPEMCGNGIRTLAQYIVDGEGTSGADKELPRQMRIHTGAGMIIPTVTPTRNIIVDMGYPIFEGAKIPTTLAPNFADGGVVEQAVTVNGRTYQASCVSMGNPHVIVFFDTMQALNEAFEKDAAALEHHEAFPANANIEFVHVTSPTHLTMRVFERGAGPTFACGTGACALTIAAVRAGRIPSAAKDVTVTLPGGDLQIRWAGPGEKVYMTGPAQKVFEGVIETDDWN